MKKPYIICHMMISIDGKITGDFFSYKESQQAGEYYDTKAIIYGKKAWLCGKNTFIDNFPRKDKIDLSKYKDVVSNYDNYYLPSTENYAICLDRKGSILWTSDKIEYPNNHLNKILQVVTRQASLEYLGYLKSLNIPYIVNGEDDLDLNSLMDTLFSQFNIDLLSVNGGGIINGSFFNEDLIDEISLIVSPMVEGNQGGSIADYKGTSPKFPKSFHLEKINRFGDSLEIIYKKEAATKR